jgi:hypothetical protein
MTTPLSMTSFTTTGTRKAVTVTNCERLDFIWGEFDTDETYPNDGEIFPIIPIPIEFELDYQLFQQAPFRGSMSRYYRPGTWFARMCALFNTVLIKRAVLEWVPRCGTGDRGNIIVSHLKDIFDVFQPFPTTTAGRIPRNFVQDGWNMNRLEALGTKSTSFPVWMNRRIELPLSGKSGFYNPKQTLADYYERNTSDNWTKYNQEVRSALPDGIWMAGVEGLSKIADDSTVTLDQLGHFRIHYIVVLSDPIISQDAQSINSGAVTVSAVSKNVMDMVHVLNLKRDSGGADIEVDRSLLDPIFSPFKRVVQIGDSLRISLDIQRSGSSQGVIFSQGVESLTFSGLDFNPIGEDGAFDVKESSCGSSAIIAKIAKGSNGSLSFYPTD